MEAKSVGRTMTFKNVYVYRDGVGRIYIDECKTPEEHMTAKEDKEANRRLCQTDLALCFPGMAFQGKGDIEITINYTPAKEEV